jgi:hypothetical protein
MNESLAAACGEFEQVLLAGMLRSASFARPPAAESTEDGDDVPVGGGSSDAFAELMTQAIATAVERAGGVGLRANLVAALTRWRT